MSNVEDLTAGDTTPKVQRASIKDLTLAVNRISYTFKTPDTLVAPDALQLGDDGNLSLGTTPKSFASIGRNFTVANTSISGGTSAAAVSLHVESASGAANLRIASNGQAANIYYVDTNYSTSPAVVEGWHQSTSTWKVQITDGTSRYDAITSSNVGNVGIGHGSLLQAKLNVGSVGGGAVNEVFVASNTTNFEGAFLGAYDNRSGAKLDLNSQANATNVSSWRLSHDFNDGGQGNLVFGFAVAATSRASLTYSPKLTVSSTGFMSLGAPNRSVGGAVRFFHLENAAGQGSIAVVRNTNDAGGGVLALAKSRGIVNGSNTIVTDQDTIGTIQFCPANGSSLDSKVAEIQGIAWGTPSATSTPGQITFATTPVNSVVPVIAMRITSQQNVSIGTNSDVAKLTAMNGVSYPSGEALLYLQSSIPATIPVIIAGSSSGTTSISGGAPQTAGGARGGQIDLIGGGASTLAGHVVLRAGTNADGLPSPVGATLSPAGMFGVNTTVPLHRFHAVANTGERIRVLMDTNGEYAGFTARRANGTAAAPTKILANDQIAFFNVHGYTGTGYIGSCGSMNIIAEQDWSDTSTSTSFVFAPGATANVGQNNRFIIKSNGNVGVNCMTPVAVFTVTSSTATNGVGLEVDPDVGNNFVQLRSYDRSATQYKGWAVAASSHLWGTGVSVANTTMALTTAGNLVVGPNPQTYINGSGTSNTTIDGQVIIAAAGYSTTAFCVSSGEKYAGLKIKVGPNTTPNGSADYYDITTRPGVTGVANNADYVMIRMESAVSKTNPDMFFQTSGAGGRVVIGGTVPTAPARLNVVGHSTGGSIADLSGNTTGAQASDLVIRRTGPANAVAGQNSSIQLTNTTNGTHILLQESDNGFQLFNNVANVWAERLHMGPTGRFVFGAHSSAAGSGAEAIQVIGGASGGNDYCYFAQASTGNQAYAMRMYSSTANATVGSISFTGSTTSYNTTSDQRLKENIVPAPFARDMIDAINVRSFNFKTDGSFWKYGFIAQELYEVAPFAVTRPVKLTGEFCQKNGVWSVDHSKLVPALVKAHQEVSSELKETKQQLVQTRAELAVLENQIADILRRLSVLDNQ